MEGGTTMSTLLGNVQSVATTLFDIAGDTVTFVVGQPLLLVFFSIAIIGAGIGIFQRLRG